MSIKLNMSTDFDNNFAVGLYWTSYSLDFGIWSLPEIWKKKLGKKREKIKLWNSWLPPIPKVNIYYWCLTYIDVSTVA